MKIYVTRQDLERAFLGNNPPAFDNIQFDIEGYMPKPKATVPAEKPNPRFETVTDASLNVISIEDLEQATGRKANGRNLNRRVDYTNYNNIVLDFATSDNKNKLFKVDLEGQTIECMKYRYKHALHLTKTKDMVETVIINRELYLRKK